MLEYLLAHYEEQSQYEIGIALCISFTSVGVKLKELGLNRGRGGRRSKWSEDQVAYLREHYADEPTCDIAEYLGTSPGTVKRMAEELGLKKSDSFNRYGYAGRLVRNYTNGIYHKDFMKPKSA